MPELPEVETIRRGLVPHLEGRRILGAQQNRPDIRLPFPERFAERLQGAKILPLGRRAKYLLVPLDTSETLIIHLGMSGRLLIEHDQTETRPGEFHHQIARHVRHDHAVIALEGGSRLVFNDPRRFGFMLLAESDALDQHPGLSSVGVEPLGNEFDAAYLLSRLAGRRTPMKSALLDQAIIAGLGNIYVSEALHRARISPERQAGAVTKHEAERLVRDIRDVLSEALEAGGSSLKDYRHEDGSLGYFQHAFRVYGREGWECPNPACSGIIRRKVQAGRSTFFCVECQR